MAWKNIPEKKVLATLKDGKDFKGTAAEKMTIYVDGGVPGSEGDVKGISMTIDPSTYVMTTQLIDGKGGNVGSPATIDLPLESMVVGGKYDEENKSIILTLKNGQTVEFSVADLVAGLQSEITPQNPLSADLISETQNKQFVTEDEKADINNISSIQDDITDIHGDIENIQGEVDGKQDLIDGSNPLDADLINDENSNKKLVSAEEKSAIEQISQGDVDKIASLHADDLVANIYNNDSQISIKGNRQTGEGEPTGLVVNLPGGQIALERGEAQYIRPETYGDTVYAGGLTAGTYTYRPQDGTTLYVDDAETTQITEAGTLIIGNSDNNEQTVLFIPTDNSGVKTYHYNHASGEVEENTVGGSGGNVIYFNAESSGYILNVENIAFYKDAQLTEEMTPSEMFQLTNKGPVNLIGMFDDGSGFIPWSSEIIVSAADDGMDGQGNSFFFRVLEGPTTGTVAYYGNKWHIGDKMIFLTASEVDGLVKKGSGAPTTSTTGEKGQIYEDTTNGKVYICTGRSGSTYTWKEVIKSGDNISTLTNDSGYQNASQVSSAIASAVGEITSFEYEVVQTLPVTGEAGKIYLVANSGTAPNIYDEYIWVNNAFEKIGTTEMDLSNYYTKTEVDTALGNKANSSDVYSKSEVNTALAGKQDTIDANHKLDADLIDNSTSDNKTYETGTGAPTTSTAGSVGEMYVDKSTGVVYVCTGVNGGVYTWSEIVAKDRVKTLTTADYNYPTSGTKTSIALWLLPEGVYNIGEALTYKANVNNTTSATGEGEYAFIIVNKVGGSTVIEEFTTLGIRRHSTNTSTGAKEGFAQLAFVDDLNTPDTSRGLTAKQGKVLNEKIPVITMTSTDPGEGSSLQANHFIAVYEA